MRYGEVVLRNDTGVSAKWRDAIAKMERCYCDMSKVSLRNGEALMRNGEVLLRHDKGVTANWGGVSANWRSVTAK